MSERLHTRSVVDACGCETMADGDRVTIRLCDKHNDSFSYKPVELSSGYQVRLDHDDLNSLLADATAVASRSE